MILAETNENWREIGGDEAAGGPPIAAVETAVHCDVANVEVGEAILLLVEPAGQLGRASLWRPKYQW